VLGSGLTGGVLYVVDEDGLSAKVHKDVRLAALDEEDEARLFTILKEHHAATGSARAEALLSSFDESKKRFVKVMPKGA